jgi:hypothetical protein
VHARQYRRRSAGKMLESRKIRSGRVNGSMVSLEAQW